MAAAAGPSLTKKTEKKKHLKAVQQKKRLFRSNDSVLSVLMWGVNHSITEMGRVKIPVMLMPDEFKAFAKIRVDNHMFNKDNMPSHYKFKECCPLVFRNLRERFGIDEMCYLNALTKRCPVDMSASGRSGARFLASYDRRFVIKAMSTDEVTKMLRILKEYHQYVVECHADTLLPQYLGMYCIKINDNDAHFFIVMRSVFSPRVSVHKIYDLKGSSIDRKASDKERAKVLPTFKDNDFINDKVTIQIELADRDRLFKMLEADVAFLTGLNLMDYSLLVGIHDSRHAAPAGAAAAPTSSAGGDPFDSEDNGLDDDESEPEAGELWGAGGVYGSSPPAYSPRRLPSTDQGGAAGPRDGGGCCVKIDHSVEVYAIKSSQQSDWTEVYFMALIDILTDYGVKKRTAQAAKTMKHGAGAEISTVPPDQYARRFLDFINRVIK